MRTGLCKYFLRRKQRKACGAINKEKPIFLKRLEMIPGLAQALFAVLDGLGRAAADTGHAVGAVAAPDRLAVLDRDAVCRAEPFSAPLQHSLP